MPEQTFRSPTYSEREIDLTAPVPTTPSGTPAAVIGTTNKGPAFVPVTFGNFDEFKMLFGDLDSKNFGPYAANEFLKYRTALTYMRVLGAGANASDADITTSVTTGRVKSAGVYLDGVAAIDDKKGRHTGVVQMLVASHDLQTEEAYGMPMFTDNDSTGKFASGKAVLVRGLIMTPQTSRVMLAPDPTTPTLFDGNSADETTISSSVFNGKFKLIISSTLGSAFSTMDGNPGVKIFTASFDPSSSDYFGKILNTDPDKFVDQQHLLYADFAVDDEIATANGAAAILSGSAATSSTSGDPTLAFRKMFGAYDARYTAPSTPYFISQPFGATEYDLFKFEAIDDGQYANTLYKLAIANLQASADDSNPYCTFTVQVRDWNDTDTNPIVLESFPNCTLNPNSDNYVAKLIGDRKVTFNFDASIPTERRIVTFGKYKNMSKYVRIVMTDAVERQTIPAKCMPFGFRGHTLLKTNDLLTDATPGTPRITGVGTTIANSQGAILPPVPFRTKVTKGQMLLGSTWLGQPSTTETVSTQLYWGVKFERNNVPLNANVASEQNGLLASFSKFMGIAKLDALTSGSGSDTLNNNKFTLARVAFSNTTVNDVTSSAGTHMKEAAYIRNGVLDTTNYTINDVVGNRITFASLLSKAPAATFNKFSSYLKFVTFMQGGWDGTNILDRDAQRMNDKSTSFDTAGGASSGYTAPGLTFNPTGVGQSNATVASYRTAIDIMTDPMIVNHNILAIPGIRESFITDYAMQKVRDYGMAYYVMDIPSYDDSQNRLYDDSTVKPSIDQTATVLDGRVIDNNYAGTYYPNVSIDDTTNNRRVKVPASVAAMGALSFNDKVAYPWFAPAGFNRAALDFVKNVDVRLNVTDRDRLYDSRINPIATFPRLGYVIYGQKTLQINKSALDRVNVRRLMCEIKRIIIALARNVVFNNNSVEERNKFVADATIQLGMIQVAAGIEAFQVVMNETNNTIEDYQANRLNGRIVVVPTRVVEYIALDFIITPSGVSFA